MHGQKTSNLYWWRTEKISWTDRVRSEEVSQTVKEKRNIRQKNKKDEGLIGFVTFCVGTAF